MIIKGLSSAQVCQCADNVGVKTSKQDCIGPETFRIRIMPIGDTYRAKSPFTERRKHAVCWHGHEAFFREVFRVNPCAVIKTAGYGNKVYHSVEELNAACHYAEYQDFGTKYRPVYLEDMCFCSQREE
jgi:hypothetical protein